VSAPSTEPPFELIIDGRVSVDLYPLQAHRELARVESFAKSLAGPARRWAIAEDPDHAWIAARDTG
jgi:hypothetical protein